MFRSAVDVAVAVGLHSDNPRLRLDPYLTEYRSRLWSYLCHADAALSLLVARPLSIDPATYSTHTLNNINLSDLVELDTAGGALTEVPSRPLTDATFATYLIFRQRLAEIVARMVQTTQGSKADDYEAVKALDADLTALHDSLPEFFKFTAPDTSYDKGEPTVRLLVLLTLQCSASSRLTGTISRQKSSTTSWLSIDRGSCVSFVSRPTRLHARGCGRRGSWPLKL